MTHRRKPKRPRRSEIARSQSVLTMLGLLFSMMGALTVVELRAQIKVTPDLAVEPGQPFSSPFRVENTGYSSLYIERVYFCVRRIQVGRTVIRESVVSDSGRVAQAFDFAGTINTVGAPSLRSLQGWARRSLRQQSLNL